MSTTWHVAIGNSDDRLAQAEWSEFRQRTDLLIRSLIEDRGGTIYGAWVSPSAEPFQNACWAFDAPADVATEAALRTGLRSLARDFRQDSIALNRSETRFLPPLPVT